jgi:pilus assembly protein CpaE
MSVEPLKKLLRFAGSIYRYIVLDVPRSDAAALDGLDTASSIVIVANQELPTVRSASRIASALRQRYGKERITIVVNRYDQHADIGHEDIEKVIEAKIKHSVPSDYRAALQALNKGRPLTLDNHNKLSAAYVRLAEDLSGAVVKKRPAPDAGLLGWFAVKRHA